MGEIARFEFRAFAPVFSRVETEIRRRSRCRDVGESAETYLIGSDGDDRNVKVRDGRLEIKRLVERRDGLERWEPTDGEAFPLSGEFVRSTLLPALGAGDVDPARSSYTLEALLDEIARPHPKLGAASVSKRRFRFAIDGCPTEIDELTIEGVAVRSAAVESEDPKAVLSVVERIGLAGYENVSYPRGIRRIMGLEPHPGEVGHG